MSVNAATIWPSTAVPSIIDAGPDGAVELGVKFRSDVPGNITGIRYYKASGNTGTHVGNLWSSTGARLATATFTGETASGWQQVNFTAPVAIAANTVYVASYHTNTGHYSLSANYFSSVGVDNAPLHALANGVSGGNGVYAYGGSSLFPASTWQTSNYWVDVVFQNSSQSDTTPPDINAVIPTAGATGVNPGSAIRITFDEAINASTINTGTIFLQNPANALVAASVTYDVASKTATLTPGSSLAVSTTYTATAKGGATGVADIAGNRMSADLAWTFTTSPAGTGNDGEAVVILTDSKNPFSEYYPEILLTEGLNLFARRDIASVTASTLSGYDVAVLGQMALTTQQVAMFTDWVGAGGKLIAMRPDKKLAPLLGLNDVGTTLSEGYLLVKTSSGPGVGIVAETIQFHGTADRYTLGSASSVATLYSTAQNATSNPAVTLRNVGANGGQAAAFTFDLARSVIYTRQGNPAWAGQDRDGLPPLRSNDLFYGAASFDPKPNWIDLNKVAIPQADEQQRLLANMIISMGAETRLLPRFWYFPRGHKAVVVMTGDDHANGGTAGRFDRFKALSPANGSVDDWETIRGSSYIFPSQIMSNSKAAGYDAAGFEIGLHLNTGCSNYTWEGLDAMFTSQLSQLTKLFPSLPPTITHRVHCIAWSGYTILPEVSLLHGIRLDTTYYYWPPGWVADKPGLFTGSGMPMRFATANGSTIDVYQANTQMTDESGQSYPLTVDTLLDRALGAEGYYGAFVANMHTDVVASSGSDAIVSSAISRGVPVITARQLLTWTDARNASLIKSVDWSIPALRFTVEADPRARGLQGMVPIPIGYTVGSVKHNGSSIPSTVKLVKGISYAFFAAATGNYEIAYLADVTAPVVSSVEPASGQSGVSRNARVMVVFSEPMDGATLNTTTFALRDSAGSLVPATVTYESATNKGSLTPNALLATATTYSATIQGGPNGVTDAAGNPMASNFAFSFTTTSSASQSSSIWPDSATPSIAAANDSGSVELGLKFKSSVNGYITKIRFYKGAGNTGTHVGNLWTTGGTRLATVVFTNESASGWQTQTLPTPVPITANTTYVVSYHAPVGRYSVNLGYFAAGGVDSPPLRALGSGESGANGVYRYGSGNLFPNQTYQSSNYWVDVEFTPGESN